MSWSVNVVGTPPKILEYIENFGTQLSGQSLAEFMDAKPILVGAVNQNFNTKPEGFPILLRLMASGSGSATTVNVDGESKPVQIDRQFQMTFERLYNARI